MQGPVNLREKIGQLLVIGFEGGEISARLTSLLHRLQPGGVILFARNIVSPEQTCQLLKDCRACVQTPIFTCVDLEGGRVDRFRYILGPTPSAAEVFASGERRLFRTHGRLIGECCRLLGFNTDFAPVLDLALEASRSVMSSRAVSADPKQVILYAREFLAGLHLAGVLGSGKHFPGLGGAALDTHHELPAVRRAWKELWNEDLQPYRMLRRQLPMILVGHANYPAVTHDSVPASLSRKWISDVLRKKIGYRGLIVSDDLEMGGVLKAAPIGEAAVQFLGAGGDVCLVCHQEELVLAAHEAIVKEAERSPKFARRVHEAARRVLAFKKKSKEARRRASTLAPAKVDRLKRRLWEFSEEVRLLALSRREAS